MFKKRGPIAKSVASKRRTIPHVTDELLVEAVQSSNAAEAGTGTSTRTAAEARPETRLPEINETKSTAVELPVKKTKQNDALHQSRLYDRELNSDLSTAVSGSKYGPKMAASNLRSSIAFDYQPDVCKEYKLNGYCGYGDSCKFLHAREDYAAGWKLDQDWKTQQREKAKPAIEEKTEPKKDTSCCVCKKDPAVDGVRLKCSDIYCEKCFLAHASKSTKCKKCDAPHNGAAVPI